MNALFVVLALLANLLLPPAAAPITGSCRMIVQKTAENPLVLDWHCEGSCAGTGFTCNERSFQIGSVVYHYCKCVNGEVVQPDSTGCTTVVTVNTTTGQHGYYCLAQGCTCKDSGVTWVASTPCGCPP